jgi:hypothetical protein
MTELQGLLANGFHFCDIHYECCVHSFVCDTPAKAFIKCIKGHAGYSGCDKCHIEGEWNGKMTFPSTNDALRTDEEFSEMSDEEHHLERSPLCDLPIGMVTQFPIDYMHLICLGVTKRLILCWMKGPLGTRLSATQISQVSDRLMGFTPYIPIDFCRKPRALNEIMRWKASEFRQFLLYTGPVVLHSILPDVLYKNFLLLSVAVRILTSSVLCHQLNEYAKQLLNVCVENMKTIYGTGIMVYNVHALIHLADDVKKFGPLDNFSSFPFENALKNIKKLVRKPTHPLQQIANRLQEQELGTAIKPDVEKKIVAKIEHNVGPVLPEWRHAKQW